MKALKRILFLAGMVIFALSWFLLTSVADVGDLRITGYKLVHKHRVGRSGAEYTYRADVTNSGTRPVLDVKAKLTGCPVHARITDGKLLFGYVPAGKTVSSRDTFTVRVNSHGSFDPGVLVWAISGTPPPDIPPVADAGRDRTVRIGDTVTLDGGRSTDADGNTLSFRWSFLSAPRGSRTRITDATSVRPTFTVDKDGEYVAQLIVNDGKRDSVPDKVTVSTRNSKPVADAGRNQTVAPGDTVTLDGSGSTDVDGDALTFAWTLISAPPGSRARLSNPGAVKPTFTADKAGTYITELVVSDGRFESTPARVVISTENSRPVADAGAAKTAFTGDTVTLDGSGSTDVDGDVLSFRWALTTKPSGSSAELSDASDVRPTFVLDSPGIYVAQLIVNDGKADSAASTVAVTTENTKPVADAGPDQTVRTGDRVSLDGSQSSDANGDAVSCRWSLVARPQGSRAVLASPLAVNPSFKVDKPGIYIAEVIVSDGKAPSDPCTVAVSTWNSRPAADAGPDELARTGDTVTLDGSGSNDADGDALTFKWSFTYLPPGSNSAIVNANAGTASFVPDVEGTYVVQLVVKDDKTASAPDTKVVTVSSGLECSIDAQPTEGNAPLQVQFSATAAGGNPPYAYAWDANGDGTVESTAAGFTYTYGAEGTYTASVKVTDSSGNVATATATVTAKRVNANPTAKAGGPYKGVVGQAIRFDGSGSSDPDGDPLTYAWQFGDGGTGTEVQPTHTYSASGTYTVTLKVQDGRGGSDTATTTATVVAPPVITGLSVLTGPVGTVVVVSGANFNAGSAHLAFGGISAVIYSLSATSITTSVPQGAVTGPVSVSTTAGSASTPYDFVVTATHDFSLTAGPSVLKAAPKSQATYTVTVTGDENFSGLVSLEATGLPDGFSGFFSPAGITSGQSSSFIVTTCDCTLSGQAAVTITGTAVIEGKTVTKSATVSLELLARGETTLSGRVVDTDENPIKNVTVSVGTAAGITDESGNFLVENPPTGDRVVLIDGFTASTDSAKYPTIPITMTIVDGAANALPYVPHFHAQKNYNFTAINPADETIVEDPGLPNFQLRIPAGVDIIGWDGEPNTMVSVRKVPLDSLPIPPPPSELQPKSIYMFYFAKRGGGVATIPIPVTAPNDLGLDPGATAELWYYNESTDINEAPNAWSLAGTGTVSADGETISTDPGVGIPRFCCGAAFWTPAIATVTKINPSSCPVGDPIDPGTGTFLHSVTDLAIPGRIPIAVTRTQRTLDTFRGPFGSGSYFSYDWYLLRSGDTLTLTMPPGSRVAFTLNRDGTFTNMTMPSYRGAVATVNSDGTKQLRMKDGTTWRFDTVGLLTEEEDRNGNRLKFEREGYTHNLLRIVGSDGKTMVSFTYGDWIQGREVITEMTDAAGRKVTYRYEYDPNEWLRASGRMVSMTDSTGGVTQYKYDSQIRMAAIIDPNGNTTVKNTYDTNGRVCRQEHANGGIWKYHYITASDASLPDTDLLLKYNFTKDPCSAKASSSTVAATIVLDPKGNPTLYRFNGDGFPTGVTDAVGQKVTNDRAQGSNLRLSSTDSLGRKTTYTYDDNGNVTSVTDPAGNVTRYEYTTDFNRVSKVTDALGGVVTFSYDGRGNLTSITDRMGNTTTMVYNSYGDVVSATDPLGHTTTFEYDDMGNLITVADPSGNRATRVYDALSRLIQATDPMGRTSSLSYDAMNRITAITDGLENLTKFAYDAAGNLLSVTDAKSHAITYAYDVSGRLSSMKDQLGALETYTYDLKGNLTGLTDRKGQTTAYTYDKMNRKVKAAYADGSAVSYVYDAVGRLLEVDDTVSGTINFEYATFGQCSSCGGKSVDKVIKETTPLGSIAYAYDALGRRTSMTVAGETSVEYSYDANGSLTEVNQADMGSVLMAHDAAGRRTLLTLPNGATTSYAYDASSRLLAMTHAAASGTIENPTYTYDAAGNRISLSTLNPQAELPEAVTAAFDAANRLLTFNDENLTYDANGNLIARIDPSGTTAYTWDARNRLVAIAGPDLSATFKYDAFNRRTEKTVNDKTIRYLYDGADIIAEMEDGIVTAKYLRSLNIDEVFARMDGNGARFYHKDGLGSTIALTDPDGQVKTRYTYGPFGATTVSGENSDNPFQYTGRENDGTGLYYYRARYYDPKLSRFISEDPIRFRGGDVNFFAYVSNSPINKIDPLGFAPGEPYATPNAAAMAAAADIRAMPNQAIEYGGWIYYVDPGTWLYGGDEPYFTYTEPRTDNQKDQVWPGRRPCDSVADYHNHPRIRPYKYNQFSPDDKYWNEYYGVSGYILTPDLGLLRYDPGKPIVKVR